MTEYFRFPKWVISLSLKFVSKSPYQLTINT